jgi:hypothetical protein
VIEGRALRLVAVDQDFCARGLTVDLDVLEFCRRDFGGQVGRDGFELGGEGGFTAARPNCWTEKGVGIRAVIGGEVFEVCGRSLTDVPLIDGVGIGISATGGKQEYQGRDEYSRGTNRPASPAY